MKNRKKKKTNIQIRGRQKRIDYEKFRQSAYELVVIQGHTQKEAAELLGISAVSMSEWAREGNWRQLRKGRQSSASTSAENLKQIISLLAERRLVIESQITEAIRDDDKELELELRKQATALSDEMSKHNKTLITTQKESRVTLGVYIDVMDDIFSTMRSDNEALWEQTIEFQQTLIRKKTNELG